MNELLHCLLEKSADAFPEGTAVVDGDREMSYRQLDAAANRIARQLGDLGVRHGDRVGLYLAKSAESLACIYGVLKAGAAYVPLAPDAPVARLSRIIHHAGIRVVLTGAELARQWAAIAGADSPAEYLVCANSRTSEFPRLSDAIVLGSEDLARQSTARPAVTADPGDVAYVLYTSGSTGVPKGVMLTHRNALSFVSWAAREFGLTRHDRLSNHAPLHFDLTIFDVFAAAYVGASMVVVPREVAMFAADLVAFVAGKDISVWYSVPSAVNVLATGSGRGPAELPRLRLVLFAGEVFPIGQLRQALAAFPRATFCNLYGPTETNVCTFYRVVRPLPEGASAIPIGQPIDGVELFCVADDTRPAAVGERGELWVSGPTVMRGYLGDPEHTADVLRALDPSRPGVLAYRTGDLALRDEDGQCHFFGRRDSQIKSRGYRIELGEIEATLNTHPDILECAVIPVPDMTYGNLIKAYVVTAESVTATALIAYLRKYLPSYMVPRSVDHVSSLPRTSTGKIDYQVLKKVANEERACLVSRSGSGGLSSMIWDGKGPLMNSLMISPLSRRASLTRLEY
jgi:amino acid adenylation domain-containing protein